MRKLFLREAQPCRLILKKSEGLAKITYYRMSALSQRV